MTSTFFVVLAVIYFTVLAFGFAQLSLIPKAVRHNDGTVSIGYRSAPVKEYVRFAIIATMSIAGAALFTVAITV